MCGPGDKDTYRGVVRSLGIQRSLPSLGVVFLSLLPSHTGNLPVLCQRLVRGKRTEVTAVNSRGSFHLLGFPLSLRLSCPHFVWSLHPPRFSLNILIKRNCTEGSVNTGAWRQVVKFLIEFSQRSQTKHETALTQKCEGGGWGMWGRRGGGEGSYFLCFLRLCSMFH